MGSATLVLVFVALAVMFSLWIRKAVVQVIGLVRVWRGLCAKNKITTQGMNLGKSWGLDFDLTFESDAVSQPQQILNMVFQFYGATRFASLAADNDAFSPLAYVDAMVDGQIIDEFIALMRRVQGNRSWEEYPWTDAELRRLMEVVTLECAEQLGLAAEMVLLMDQTQPKEGRDDG